MMYCAAAGVYRIITLETPGSDDLSEPIEISTRQLPNIPSYWLPKGIVHHVQQQDPPGRFLVAQKKTGLWFATTYKKAVDKTSQALRERERENEGIADVKVVSLKNAPKTPQIDALARPGQVAAKASKIAAKGSSSKRLKATKPKDPTLSQLDLCKPLRSSDMVAEATPTLPVLDRSGSWFWSNRATAKPTAKRQKINGEKPRQPTATSLPPDDPLPLPTQPLKERTSSIFRFFQNSSLAQPSRLGPQAASSHLGPGPTTKKSPPKSDYRESSYANTMSNAIQSQFDDPEDEEEEMTFADLQKKRSAHIGNALEPLPFNKKKRLRDADPLAHQPRQLSRHQIYNTGVAIDAQAAPSLTRLSSQVSDWLSSFWPLGDEQRQRPPNSGSVAANQQQQQAQQQNNQQQQQQQNNQQQLLQQQIIQQRKLLDQMQAALNSANVLGMPSAPACAQSGLQPTPLAATGNGSNNRRGIPTSTPASTEEAPDAAAALIQAQVQNHFKQYHQQQQSRELQTQHHHPSLQQHHAQFSDDSDKDVACGAVAEHTELTESVSSTLLQLASSPTKLFSSFSALFNDRKSHSSNETEMMAASSLAMLHQTPSPSQQPPTSRTPSSGNANRPLLGRRSSGKSLIDDDDDDDDDD